MNRRYPLSVALVAACLLVAQQPASAQSRGSQGTMSSSSRSTGTGRSGIGSRAGSAAGSASTLSAAQGYDLDSRFTGSGFDRFMSGSTAMGQTTAGAGAATSGAFGQSAAGAGQMGGQSNQFGGLGGMGGYGSMGRFGGMGNFGMMGMRNMFNRGMQTNQQAQGKIRTHMLLGFDPASQPTTVVNARFSTVLKRVLERQDVGGGQVNVEMDGSTAVLTGTVATEHARDLIERLAMLEPGIADVRNELRVSPVEPTRASAPTSSTGGQPQ